MKKLILFLQVMVCLTNTARAVIVAIDQLKAKNKGTQANQITIFYDYHTTQPNLEHPQIELLKDVFIKREQEENVEPLHVFIEEPSKSYMLLGKTVLGSIGNEIKETCQKTTTENIEIRCVAKALLQLFDQDINPYTIFQKKPYSILPTVNSSRRTIKLDEPCIQDLSDEFNLYNDEIVLWQSKLPEHITTTINNYSAQQHMQTFFKGYQILLNSYDSRRKIIEVAQKLYFQDQDTRKKFYESVHGLFSNLFNIHICMKILSRNDSKHLALFLGASHAMWVRSLLQDFSLYDCCFSVANDYQEEDVKPLDSSYISNVYSSKSWTNYIQKVFKCCTIQ